MCHTVKVPPAENMVHAQRAPLLQPVSQHQSPVLPVTGLAEGADHSPQSQLWAGAVSTHSEGLKDIGGVSMETCVQEKVKDKLCCQFKIRIHH